MSNRPLVDPEDIPQNVVAAACQGWDAHYHDRDDEAPCVAWSEPQQGDMRAALSAALSEAHKLNCPLVRDDDATVERAAFELYAAGPWGSFEGFADDGLRALTDSHSMEVYRRLARAVLAAAQIIEAGEPDPSSRRSYAEKVACDHCGSTDVGLEWEDVRPHPEPVPAFQCRTCGTTWTLTAWSALGDQ